MNFKKIAGVALVAVGLGLAATPMAQATGGKEHREVVCHAEGNGSFHAIPPAKASAHIPKHEKDFILVVTYVPSRDGKWNVVKDKFNDLCNGGTPTVTTVTPGPTETVTVTGPATTVTQVVTPTETAVVTGTPTTVTNTVTPTETATVTGPASTVTVTAPAPTVTSTVTPPATTVTTNVPGATKTVAVKAPDTIVTQRVKGDTVTKVVDENGEVVEIYREPSGLAYTGANDLLYLFIGLLLVSLGANLILGRRLAVIRKG